MRNGHGLPLILIILTLSSAFDHGSAIVYRPAHHRHMKVCTVQSAITQAKGTCWMQAEHAQLDGQ